MNKNKLIIFIFAISAIFAFAVKAQNLNITPLMNAVINNDIKGTKFFSRSSGKAGVNQKNFGGATALHLAVRNNNEEIVNILINAGADVNAKDNEGFTPLMRAAMSGNYQILQILAFANASPFYFNNAGESVIVNSASSGCTKCLQILFAKFNFKESMAKQPLIKQLEEAFLLAQRQQNEDMEKVISDYLNRVLTEEKPEPVKAQEEKKKVAAGILVIEEQKDLKTNQQEKSQQQQTKEQSADSALITTPKEEKIQTKTNEEKTKEKSKMEEQIPSLIKPQEREVWRIKKNPEYDKFMKENANFEYSDEKVSGKSLQYIPPFY